MDDADADGHYVGEEEIQECYADGGDNAAGDGCWSGCWMMVAMMIHAVLQLVLEK